MQSHPDIVVDLVTVIHDPERTADAADIEIRFTEELASSSDATTTVPGSVGVRGANARLKPRH